MVIYCKRGVKKLRKATNGGTLPKWNTEKNTDDSTNAVAIIAEIIAAITAVTTAEITMAAVVRRI